MNVSKVNDDILSRVEKPVRYIGGELNEVIKDVNDIDINDNINIVVKTGKINASVKGVNKNEWKERNEVWRSSKRTWKDS